MIGCFSIPRKKLDDKTAQHKIVEIKFKYPWYIYFVEFPPCQKVGNQVSLELLI